MKKPYIAPQLEVYQYEVERGFAQSAHLEPDEFLADVSDSLENVTEGHQYNLYVDDTWF